MDAPAIASSDSSPRQKAAPLRLGGVSYLNARPLLWGLEGEDVTVELDIPSRLLDGLRRRRFDVALLPVIDYQRVEGLRLIPAGGIGCDGPALTVRIFSHVPVEQIRRLACDTESHTSVALARVVLAELYSILPEMPDLRSGGHNAPEAMLLIGDKVVCDPPCGFAHQFDLGQAWKQLTGLPFVFAAWVAGGDVELHDLPRRLAQARAEGMNHIEAIVAEHAQTRGWPVETARQYLTRYMRYEMGPQQLRAMELFFERAARHGVLSDPIRPIVLYDSSERPWR